MTYSKFSFQKRKIPCQMHLAT